MPSGGTVLVAGFSARALARSALAAGFRVAVVDGFGDRDLLEPAPQPVARRTIHPFDPDRAAEAAASLSADAVVYTSNLENHPDAVARLCRGRSLLGNAPEVLVAVRDATRLSRTLDAAGLPAARVYDEATAREAGVSCLVKPRRSGGGYGIRRWRPGEPLREGELLQEWVDGVPASLLFAADGVDVLPLGLTRQLIGDAAFGARDFHWCGNLLGGIGVEVLPRAGEVLAGAVAAAAAITRAFGLRGVNGIDCIARDGEAVVIEVNPRWTAAMELAERACGTSLFPTHVAACEGRLEAPPGPRPGACHGKAVVCAPSDSTAPDTDAWLADADIRDVPSSGSALPRGAPVCTVFAEALSDGACHAALVRRAHDVIAAVAPVPPPR
jgi:predicted ATP-grasp superfamily ATP-dependent carboligase